MLSCSAPTAPTFRARVWFAAALLLLLVGSAIGSPAAAQPTGSIVGTAFQDHDRDTTHDPDEAAWQGHRLYVFDAAGAYVANAVTDESGHYRVDGLPGGTYTVSYAPGSWWDVREDWVPTTVATLRPEAAVDVVGEVRLDFGWRPIITSRDLSAPLTSVTDGSGVTVASYVDTVSAQEVLASLRQGSLIGIEAPSTTVRFGATSSSSCTNGITRSDGRYTAFTATCYVSYLSWLDGGDRTLFHEYGHAWGLHHAYLTQQDPDLTGYLEARGLLGDPRLDSSHAWSAVEILAEDYRQLFGSATARADGQMNNDIPEAADVAGLRAYLSGDFITPPSSDPVDTDPVDPDPGADDDDPAPPATVATHVLVTDLDGDAVSGRRGAWSASVEIQVVDDLDQPVAGAAVDVHLDPSSGRASDARCTTTADGRCAIGMELRKQARTLSATVIAVSADLPHDASAHRDAEGDSDGTTILVSRP